MPEIPQLCSDSATFARLVRAFFVLEAGMQLCEMMFRKCDGHGCGHFGASRGQRKHMGIDLACVPGTAVCSPVRGVVTKLGYPYGDDLAYRYVEVSTQGYQYRVFYVDPVVAVGDQVNVETVIGRSQRLGARYQAITEHVHFEVKDPDGGFVDPTPIILSLAV
ncbi:M23 family metallopeptidase [Marinobacter sp. 1Y8]